MLTGTQTQQIHTAILDAFDEAGLRQMAQFHLNERLDQVAGGQNFAETALNLVNWADQQNRILDLINGALAENPNNEAITQLVEDAGSWRIEPPAEGESPYMGLRYFDTEDAECFFGREALTAQLVGFLRDHSFLAVIGASGSGKSSVVRAGIVPALRGEEPLADMTLPPKFSRTWPAFIITPTAHPIKALAASLTSQSESVTAQATLMDDLARDCRSLDLFASRMIGSSPGMRLLLIVDQFEEMFTLCRDRDERKAFVDNLLAAAVPDGVTTVIITLRADFYAQCADYGNLRQALENCQRYIGPMHEDELRQAIVLPAEHGGWDLEAGLADLILADVADEPGSLPLLSHALYETWKYRRGRTMTFAGYHEIGGVKGGIAKTAETVFAQNLESEEQAIAKNIFLRLTELGEGVQDTRRRTPIYELIPSGQFAPKVEAVLQILEDARLITTSVDEATIMRGTDDQLTAMYVDVTHEALIREWPTLRGWLDDNREGLRIHRHLTDSAEEWQQLGRDPGELYRGARLEQAVLWASEHEDSLNELEREFLESGQRRLNEQQKEKERIDREREEARQRELQQAKALNTRQRWLLIAVSAFLMLAIVAGYFIITQYQRDQQELKATRLLESAMEKKSNGDAVGAIADLTALDALESNLDVDIEAAIEDVRRVVATQYAQEGQRLLKGLEQVDHPDEKQKIVAQAAYQFADAVDLEPPPDTLVYVWVPPGEFTMGSTLREVAAIVAQKEDREWNDYWDEMPAHRVQEHGFWIMRTEVTNAQYAACIEADVCDEPGNSRWKERQFAQHPIINVSWYGAKQYADWVGGRLPTEAEWEKACRGTDGRIYPWGDDEPSTKLLNYPPSRLGILTEVGNYPDGASYYGLFDMGGNAWEWTEDWHDDSYYGNSPFVHPEGPDTEGIERSLRGGAYVNDNVHCAYRDSNKPKERGNVGFRVVIPNPLVEE